MCGYWCCKMLLLSRGDGQEAGTNEAAASRLGPVSLNNSCYQIIPELSMAPLVRISSSYDFVACIHLASHGFLYYSSPHISCFIVYFNKLFSFPVARGARWPNETYTTPTLVCFPQVAGHFDASFTKIEHKKTDLIRFDALFGQPRHLPLRSAHLNLIQNGRYKAISRH